MRFPLVRSDAAGLATSRHVVRLGAGCVALGHGRFRFAVACTAFPPWSLTLDDSPVASPASPVGRFGPTLPVEATVRNRRRRSATAQGDTCPGDAGTCHPVVPIPTRTPPPRLSRSQRIRVACRRRRLATSAVSKSDWKAAVVAPRSGSDRLVRTRAGTPTRREATWAGSRAKVASTGGPSRVGRPEY
jgi:hypothetical protein